jgi:hypothetical protein
MTKLFVVMLLLAGSCARAGMVVTLSGFTPAEENVLTYAIGDWESRIGNHLSMDVLIRKDQLPRGVLASTSQFQMNAAGFPRHALIEISDESSLFFPWFIDPTPSANEEFAAGRWQDSWIAPPGSPAFGQYDLLTVAEHELTHAVGFNEFSPLFAAHVRLEPDGIRYYEGNQLMVPLTPTFLGTHTEQSLLGPDLMNAFFSPNQRFAPSYYDLAILDDAFGYGIPLPPPPVTAPEPASFFYLAAGTALLLLARTSLVRRPLQISNRIARTGKPVARRSASA